MHKKMLASVIGAVCLLGAMQAHAAAIGDQKSNKVEVSVHVPDNDFKVELLGTTWPANPIPLNYNPVSNQFASWTPTLQILNKVAGSKVQASITALGFVEDAVDSTKKMDLSVKIDGADITTRPTVIHTTGPTEVLKPLALEVVHPGSAPDSGDYTGSVVFVFDLVAA